MKWIRLPDQLPPPFTEVLVWDPYAESPRLCRLVVSDDRELVLRQDGGDRWLWEQSVVVGNGEPPERWKIADVWWMPIGPPAPPEASS